MRRFRRMNSTSFAIAALISLAILFSTMVPRSIRSRSLYIALGPLARSLALARRPLVLPFRSYRRLISCMLANQ